jgi:hypothetical protein
MDRSIFKYGLQALLRKHLAELDGVKVELSAAIQQVDVHTRELQTQSTVVAQLHSQQRDLSKPGALIDVEARMRLHDCLRNAVLVRARQSAQLDQSTRDREQVAGRLQTAQQHLQAIERHREQALAQFAMEQLRKAQLATDELYLSNRHAVLARKVTVGRS